MAKANTPTPIRCAIYTRKSTDEGLNQDFNSLDAQREAAEAYIKSQAGEGWRALPELYDDGGYTGDASPAFSPDGNALIFSRFRLYASELYLLKLGSDCEPLGTPERVTAHGASAYSATWLPNSDGIVYVAGSFRAGSLWRKSLREGEDPVRLSFAGQQLIDVALAGKKERLAFTTVSRDSNIWRAKIPSSGEPAEDRQRLLASTFEEAAPRYSPDGSLIAYRSNRSGNFEIWVSNSDGSDTRQMTDFRGPDAGNPNWSPDGSLVAFRGEVGGQGDLWYVSVNGGEPIRMTMSDVQEGGEARWSRDGKWVYFHRRASGREECWKMPPNGGEPVQVTTEGGGSCQEGPDGKYVYYNRSEDGRYVVRRMPIEGGESEFVLGPLLSHHHFKVVDTGIYYIAAREEEVPPTLRLYDFETRESTQLLSLPEPMGWGMDISPDERHLIYIRQEGGGSDIMLVENFQ